MFFLRSSPGQGWGSYESFSAALYGGNHLGFKVRTTSTGGDENTRFATTSATLGVNHPYPLGSGWFCGSPGIDSPGYNYGWEPHHVALIYDVQPSGAVQKIFVDGRLAYIRDFGMEPDGFPDAPIVDPTMGSARELVIGKEGSMFQNYFNGMLDNLRFYARALSDEEVVQIFSRECDAENMRCGNDCILNCDSGYEDCNGTMTDGCEHQGSFCP